MATSSDTIPDGTVFSASTTPMLPTTNSKVPRVSVGNMCVRFGRGQPRNSIQLHMISPAVKKREAPIKNGGKLSRANLMAM
jgi:hypothetical protein